MFSAAGKAVNVVRNGANAAGKAVSVVRNGASAAINAVSAARNGANAAGKAVREAKRTLNTVQQEGKNYLSKGIVTNGTAVIKAAQNLAKARNVLTKSMNTQSAKQHRNAYQAQPNQRRAAPAAGGSRKTRKTRKARRTSSTVAHRF